MKKIKKLVAIALAAVMVMAMGTFAMAAETTASTDTGTITISGVESGLTVNAYKIAEAEYDSSTGQFTGYKMLYTVTDGFTINSDGSYNEDALTEANLSALFTAAQQGGVTASATADANGNAVFSDLAIGSYLFVVTGSESTVYGMIIGSVSYDVDEDGNWATDNGSVSVSDDNQYWAKSSTPTVEKVETGGDIESGDWEHGGTADVGDTLEYHITVGPIPSYEGSYPEFEVIDTIDSKLTITDQELANMVITIGEVTLVKDTDYTVEPTDDGFIVDFVVDGKYTLNDYVGQSLVIDFCADVIEAGDINGDDADHENDAKLIYATTSYVLQADGSYYEGEDEDADHDYTFNAKILKTDNEDEPQALADAQFTLYTDDACNNVYSQNGTDMVVTSGSDGYFEFTGLEAGTYYFKETKAPAGYQISTAVYKLVITATEKEDGTLDTYTITVYDSDGNSIGNAAVTATNASIKNVKTGLLPSTGGRGTLIFTIIGCAIVVCAVVGVVATRRRRAA